MISLASKTLASLGLRPASTWLFSSAISSRLLKLSNVNHFHIMASGGEATRLIEQGGVKIDGVTISDKALKLEAGRFVAQVGKRKFARVTLS